jgi:hypothetical protein
MAVGSAGKPGVWTAARVATEMLVSPLAPCCRCLRRCRPLGQQTVIWPSARRGAPGPFLGNNPTVPPSCTAETLAGSACAPARPARLAGRADVEEGGETIFKREGRGNADKVITDYKSCDECESWRWVRRHGAVTSDVQAPCLRSQFVGTGTRLLGLAAT